MATPGRVFLDANAIRGGLTTDVLLRLAGAKLFEPRWSHAVIDEMRRNRPPGVSEEKIDYRIAEMNKAYPEAMISGHEFLIPRMRADDNDKHVLAAAVHSDSEALVTENVRHFDPPSSGSDAMRIERTSEFLNRLMDSKPGQVTSTLQRMVAHNRFEPRSMPALIDKMAKAPELVGFARRVNAAVAPEQRGSHPKLGGQREPTSIALDGVAPAEGAAVPPPGVPRARSTAPGPEQGPERGPGRGT